MSKTPVSILQEYMTKRNIMPSYEILANSEGIGTHIPTFYYKVSADGLSAVGKGRSKKEAKHEAARLLLDKLTDQGNVPSIQFVESYSSDILSGYPINMPNIPSSPIHSTTPDPGSPSRVQVNAIGTLTELCYENNIPLPQFELIADVGPAHLRQFTVECKVATLTVTATDLTKKKARQTAAQKMLHRLIDTLPEFLQEINNEVSNFRAIEPNEDVIKTFNELSTLNKRKTNWGIKISDSPKELIKIMEEKNLKYEDLWKVPVINI